MESGRGRARGEGRGEKRLYLGYNFFSLSEQERWMTIRITMREHASNTASLNGTLPALFVSLEYSSTSCMNSVHIKESNKEQTKTNKMRYSKG